MGLLIEGQLIFAWKGTVSVPRGHNCFVSSQCFNVKLLFFRKTSFFLKPTKHEVAIPLTYLLALIRENDKIKKISTITRQQSIFVLHSPKPKKKPSLQSPTGPVQGKNRENPVFNIGFPGDENRFFPVLALYRPCRRLQ